MFSLSPLTRVFVYSAPTDMRRQFDGLAALVKHVLAQDVLAGDYFIFFNRSCTLCKALRWEGDGFSIWAKRLESGRFQLPDPSGDSLAREVDAVTLSLILNGIDLRTAQRRKRFTAPPIGVASAVTNSSSDSPATGLTVCSTS